MSGPITNYELGKSIHREYEAQASRYWGRDLDGNRETILTKGHKLALALSGATAAILLIVGTLIY
jgi:hypothetical protein